MPDSLETAFRMRLEKLRKELKLSQAEVADRVGVPQQTVWKWENGEQRIRLDDAAALAEALGVPLASFLPAPRSSPDKYFDQVRTIENNIRKATEEADRLEQEIRNKQRQLDYTRAREKKMQMRLDSLLASEPLED